MTFNPDIFIWFPIFLFSLTLHEYAHALTAKLCGDRTSELQGRLTLNPLPHIDWMFTVAFPIIAFMTGAPLLGGAKPVPVNTVNLRKSVHEVYVALAGPASNIILGTLILLVFKVVIELPPFETMSPREIFEHPLGKMLFFAVTMNFWLALFNMLPIPPLDGSWLIYHFFIRRNYRWQIMWMQFSQYAIVVLFMLVMLPPVRAGLGYLFSIPMTFVIWFLFR